MDVVVRIAIGVLAAAPLLALPFVNAQADRLKRRYGYRRGGAVSVRLAMATDWYLLAVPEGADALLRGDMQRLAVFLGLALGVIAMLGALGLLLYVPWRPQDRSQAESGDRLRAVKVMFLPAAAGLALAGMALMRVLRGESSPAFLVQVVLILLLGGVAAVAIMRRR